MCVEAGFCQIRSHIITVKTNVLPQHIIEVHYNGLKIGLFLCAVIAHFLCCDSLTSLC